MPVRAVVVAALALVAAPASTPAGPLPRAPFATAASPVSYSAPVGLRVVRPFAPPETPYGPGHLGVDLRVSPGETVRSAGAGVVRFAGPVAGRGVVVVLHPDGVRTEYEPVRPLVRVGAAVTRNQPIAEIRGRHLGCEGTCLHWGARRGDTYLDPLSLLRPLGPVVLLPWARR